MVPNILFFGSAILTSQNFRLNIFVIAQMSVNGKFVAKKSFSDSASYVTITDADIGSLKYFHALFDTYLGHMMLGKFGQNRMVLNIQNF